MNRYLQKLHSLEHAAKPPNVKTGDPYPPSKPSKPPFEGFEGDRGCARSRILKPSALVLAMLQEHCPDHVERGRWQQAVEDGRRFLETGANRRRRSAGPPATCSASTCHRHDRTRLIVAYPGTTRPASSGSCRGGRLWRSRPPLPRSRTPPGPSPSIAGMTNRHLARSATAWTTFNDRS